MKNRHLGVQPKNKAHLLRIIQTIRVNRRVENEADLIGAVYICLLRAVTAQAVGIRLLLLSQTTVIYKTNPGMTFFVMI